MNTVLFLGAGATRAQYLSELHSDAELLKQARKRRKSIVRPFCGGDFFTLAWLRCHNDFPIVRSYFVHHYGKQFVDLGRHRDAATSDVEERFSDLLRDVTTIRHPRPALRFVDRLGSTGRARKANALQYTLGEMQRRAKAKNLFAKAAWHHLLVCYRKLIACSTNVLSLPCGSPVCDLLCNLSAKRANLSVLTTNQDLVAERILSVMRNPTVSGLDPLIMGTSRPAALPASFAPPREVYNWSPPPRKNPQGAWGIQRVYNLEFTDTRLMPSRSENQPREFTPGGWPEVPVLKLHGSMNWWYGSSSSMDPAPLRTPPPLCLMLNIDVLPPMGVQSDSEIEPYFFPVVVPFVRDKSTFLHGLLEPVWQYARKALSTCDRLVVFGYGFPPADREAACLFKNHLNKNVQEITVIDRRCNPAKRLRDWGSEGGNSFGGRVKWFKTVESYVRGCEENLRCHSV